MITWDLSTIPHRQHGKSLPRTLDSEHENRL
jgi:hypothetical protein